LVIINEFMKSKIIITLLLASLVLFGCTILPVDRLSDNATVNDNLPKLSITKQIVGALKAGATIKEIDWPDLALLAEINPGQINKYFRLGDILFALVQKNSMNVVLNLPANFTPTFAGVLAAQPGDTGWSKLIELKDAQVTDKNNPYYLTVDNKRLLLTVVDQNGAGSGEGLEKVFVLAETGDWKLLSCYYFGASYSDAATDGDYFAFSAKFSEQTPQSLAACGNVKLIAVK